MKNMNEPQKIEDSQMESVSGGGRGSGQIAKHDSFMDRIKNFFGFGKKEELRKGNFLDESGVYHINCVECGKKIRSWRPMPGSCYACGPQICDECKEKAHALFMDRRE